MLLINMYITIPVYVLIHSLLCDEYSFFIRSGAKYKHDGGEPILSNRYITLHFKQIVYSYTTGNELKSGSIGLVRIC